MTAEQNARRRRRGTAKQQQEFVQQNGEKGGTSVLVTETDVKDNSKKWVDTEWRV